MLGSTVLLVANWNDYFESKWYIAVLGLEIVGSKSWFENSLGKGQIYELYWICQLRSPK